MIDSPIQLGNHLSTTIRKTDVVIYWRIISLLATSWGRYTIECHYFVCFVYDIISVLFHYDNCCYFWDVYVHGHSFWTLDLSFLITGCFWFCNVLPSDMFLSPDLLSEYWMEDVIVRFLYVNFVFSTTIFWKGVSGFTTTCSTGRLGLNSLAVFGPVELANYKPR